MFDLLIRGAKIVDGTGSAWFIGDIGIIDDIIVEVRRYRPGDRSPAHAVIEADGMVAAPGFIDIHSHSDDSILANPRAESKIHQGVTTEVIGNCGYSLAPALGEALESIRGDLEYLSIEVTWRTFGEYLDVVERSRPSVNIVPLVGHGTIRSAVVGKSRRAPTSAELAKMMDLVQEAMCSGAFGLSTGLIYPPSCYAGIDEIVNLARIAREFGGIYASHIRDEGDMLHEAVEEAIAVGERTGIPVEISHHKAQGRQNWGKVKDTLRMMEDARSRGIDVACDVYPYTASSTGLSVIIPSWVADGGTRQMMERLRDERVLERLRPVVEHEQGEKLGWDKIVISQVKSHKNKIFEGKDLATIAKESGMTPFDISIRLLLEEGMDVGTVRFGMCEDDVKEVMAHPLSSIGSDATARAPYGALSSGKPHPRAYGTFPRVLARYWKEERIFPLEEAIRKMSALPAQRLGLTRRGVIRPGMFADITIFDENRIADKATFADPHRYAEGIDYVIVNGKLSLEQNAATDARAGRVLRMK
ncbi:MAG: D-aminoacylase [Firmicutes bacterium]|nr:D-aminoacylase [Bacillota bacterium]